MTFHCDPTLGQQLAFDDMQPQVGAAYKNIHTGEISVVLEIWQRRYAWVTFRRSGRTSTDSLRGFLENNTPTRIELQPGVTV